MKFKLIKAQQYHDLEEVQLEDVVFPLDDDDASDLIIVGQLEDGDYDEATVSIDEDMSESAKKTVNTTAQYIVYSVIIVMAIAFSIGICLLMYWWCCRRPSAPSSLNPVDGASTLLQNE